MKEQCVSQAEQFFNVPKDALVAEPILQDQRVASAIIVFGGARIID